MTSPQRVREGVQKIEIWGDFQGLLNWDDREWESKNWKFEVTSFMDDPLQEILKIIILELSNI